MRSCSFGLGTPKHVPTEAGQTAGQNQRNGQGTLDKNALLLRLAQAVELGSGKMRSCTYYCTGPFVSTAIRVRRLHDKEMRSTVATQIRRQSTGDAANLMLNDKLEIRVHVERIIRNDDMGQSFRCRSLSDNDR